MKSKPDKPSNILLDYVGIYALCVVDGPVEESSPKISIPYLGRVVSE